MTEKAVLLVSGGLDSATMLAMAKQEKYELYTMSFQYGQRASVELEYSKKLAKAYNVKQHKVVNIDLRAFGGSALTDDIDVPKNEDSDGIPITYVPARNTIFLSYALGWAEVLGAFDVFIGANCIDYSGYPDCRPEFLNAFQDMANLALAATVQGERQINIQAPLLHLSKTEIIAKGLSLGVNYENSFSCYDPDDNGISCGECDSCRLRLQGFSENNVNDPIEYGNDR
jgi:7-cyano-7-deazaguanine synthase